MAVGTNRPQILDRIQNVGSACARDWFDVVNLYVICGFCSIRSKEVKTANTRRGLRHFAQMRSRWSAYGSFQVLRSGFDFFRREVIGAPAFSLLSQVRDSGSQKDQLARSSQVIFARDVKDRRKTLRPRPGRGTWYQVRLASGIHGQEQPNTTLRRIKPSNCP